MLEALYQHGNPSVPILNVTFIRFSFHLISVEAKRNWTRPTCMSPRSDGTTLQNSLALQHVSNSLLQWDKVPRTDFLCHKIYSKAFTIYDDQHTPSNGGDCCRCCIGLLTSQSGSLAALIILFYYFLSYSRTQRKNSSCSKTIATVTPHHPHLTPHQNTRDHKFSPSECREVSIGKAGRPSQNPISIIHQHQLISSCSFCHLVPITNTHSQSILRLLPTSILHHTIATNHFILTFQRREYIGKA